ITFSVGHAVSVNFAELTTVVHSSWSDSVPIKRLSPRYSRQLCTASMRHEATLPPAEESLSPFLPQPATTASTSRIDESFIRRASSNLAGGASAESALPRGGTARSRAREDAPPVPFHVDDDPAAPGRRVE